jgi:uncharacterized paraquat-inducible protein A
VVTCTKCDASLNTADLNSNTLSSCPACAVRIRADVYPAAFKPPPAGSAGDRLLAEKEASCFYHGSKKAIIACSTCGRFLCALCDVEFNEVHLCPQCFEKGRTQQKIIHLENKRTCYDSIALHVATLPLLFSWPFLFFPTLLTAPMVIYICIRYWKAPTSIIERTRARFITALGIACLQIVGWALFFGNLMT